MSALTDPTTARPEEPLMPATGTAKVAPPIAAYDQLGLAEELINGGRDDLLDSQRPRAGWNESSTAQARLGAAYAQLEHARSAAKVAEAPDGTTEQVVDELDGIQLALYDVADAIAAAAVKVVELLAGLAIGVWLLTLAQVPVPRWFAYTAALTLVGWPLLAPVVARIRLLRRRARR
jgi:hypothetical protein